MKIVVGVAEDRNSASGQYCSDGKASQVTPVYVNVAKYSDPMELELSLTVQLTESTPMGTRLGGVSVGVKKKEKSHTLLRKLFLMYCTPMMVFSTLIPQPD